ncbi:MAG: hypothetical protein R2752_20155 [Vicinamibacterales bacterium]
MPDALEVVEEAFALVEEGGRRRGLDARQPGLARHPHRALAVGHDRVDRVPQEAVVAGDVRHPPALPIDDREAAAGHAQRDGAIGQQDPAIDRGAPEDIVQLRDERAQGGAVVQKQPVRPGADEQALLVVAEHHRVDLPGQRLRAGQRAEPIPFQDVESRLGQGRVEHVVHDGAP